MKITLTINGKAIAASLEQSAAAADFAATLPVTVTLKDFVNTEKIYYPPRKLDIKGSPAGIDPAIGDINYYAPWGNVAIFYRDAPYANGLVRLGRIDGSDVEALRGSGDLQVTIERAD